MKFLLLVVTLYSKLSFAVSIQDVLNANLGASTGPDCELGIVYTEGASQPYDLFYEDGLVSLWSPFSNSSWYHFPSEFAFELRDAQNPIWEGAIRILYDPKSLKINRVSKNGSVSNCDLH